MDIKCGIGNELNIKQISTTKKERNEQRTHLGLADHVSNSKPNEEPKKEIIISHSPCPQGENEMNKLMQDEHKQIAHAFYG